MKRVKKLVVIVFVAAVLAVLAVGAGRAAYQGAKPAPAPAKPAAAGAADAQSPNKETTGATNNKYDDPFDHFVDANAKEAHNQLTSTMQCDTCHMRSDDNPTPERPYHDSCVRCHATQFTDAKLSICIDCHSTPFKEKPVSFPKKLNQFGMDFSHNTHSKRADFKCETCHSTPADGKTAHSSFPDHPECYTCHKAVNQPAKGNCAECHTSGAAAQKFRDRGSIDIAYKYFKFNHGIHLNVGKTCEECHDVVNSDNSNTKTDVSRIKLVFTTDPTKIHKSTCFKCHDPNPNGTGPQCLKCHAQSPGTLAANPPKEYLNAK